MSRRGVFVMAIVCALVVAGVWIVMLNQRYATTPATNPAADGGGEGGALTDRFSGPVIRSDRKECWDLQKKYAETWEPASKGCDSDDDCVVEPREAMWAGLDDCYRIYNKDLSHNDADALARQWQGLGCTDVYSIATHESCPALPAAHCRDRQCIQRPEAPVPIDWRFHTVPHAFRLFAPPDFIRAKRSPDDHSLGGPLLVLRGKGRMLSIEASTDRRRALPPIGYRDDWERLLSPEKPVLIDGHNAKLYMIGEGALKDGGPTRVRYVSGLLDVGLAGLGYTSYVVGNSAQLTFQMQCDSQKECEPFAMILEQTDLLATVHEAVKMAPFADQDHAVELRGAEYWPYVGAAEPRYPEDVMWGFYPKKGEMPPGETDPNPDTASEAAVKCATQSYAELHRFIGSLPKEFDDVTDAGKAKGVTRLFYLWTNDYSKAADPFPPGRRPARLWYWKRKTPDPARPDGFWKWESTLTQQGDCKTPNVDEALTYLREKKTELESGRNE